MGLVHLKAAAVTGTADGPVLDAGAESKSSLLPMLKDWMMWDLFENLHLSFWLLVVQDLDLLR